MLPTLTLERPLLETLAREGRLLADAEAVPELPKAVFEARLERFEAAREQAGLDAVVVYADREHAANLLWLTGFAPRFEEALLVAVAGRTPHLLVGNENLEYARFVAQIPLEPVLYQHFSLPDQPRDMHRDLSALFAAAGLERGARVGVIGWKPATALEHAALEVPHFIVEALEGVIGARPTNAAALLVHPKDGLRATLEPEMIALFEYGARLTSQAVLHLIAHLRPGMTEREAAGFLNAHGLELACHPMVNFAPQIVSGLGSPRNRALTRGDYAQVAFGVIGALTCRAARVVTASDPDADDYAALQRNYLEVSRAWYAAVRVGARGGDVVRAVEAVRSSAWSLALNPGHAIHLDEWLGSPFTPGSSLALPSGAALQHDLIPVPNASRACINMEDGVVLADALLRADLERTQGALMRRVEQRRALMQRLGYALHEDVLPLSDSAGVTMPYLFEPQTVALVG
jgi:Xaa-Pro aminopeptidase